MSVVSLMDETGCSLEEGKLCAGEFLKESWEAETFSGENERRMKGGV